MAFRFKREGQYIKHRVHWERSGMRTWIDEFKWEVMAWHYKFWMGPQAKTSLLQNQEGKVFIKKRQFGTSRINSK